MTTAITRTSPELRLRNYAPNFISSVTNSHGIDTVYAGFRNWCQIRENAMLRNHMDAREGHLVAISQVPANAGHSLHKGTPREAFVREFLETHLPSNVSIGTGEIIDAYSQPGQQRNQFDIVILQAVISKIRFRRRWYLVF
ncbi:MAG: hypothetical protein KIT00_00660 [Rhodospirillales bacterium]|nr:hypothetical protein [Rhodospirillales bacterium]